PSLAAARSASRITMAFMLADLLIDERRYGATPPAAANAERAALPRGRVSIDRVNNSFPRSANGDFGSARAAGELHLRQSGDEGAERDLIALLDGEAADAAGAGRVQHVLHLHGFDNGDAVALRHRVARCNEYLGDTADDGRAHAAAVVFLLTAARFERGPAELRLAHVVQHVDGRALPHDAHLSRRRQQGL